MRLNARPRNGIVLAAGVLLAAASAAPADDDLGASARAQINALVREKESRTPAQKKLDANLLYALRQHRHESAAPGMARLETDVAIDDTDVTEVDITAAVDDEFLGRLRTLGAQIISEHRAFRNVRARLDVGQLEALAEDPAVIFVAPKREGFTWGRSTGGANPSGATQALALNVSEGDVTHRADLARSTFGVSGAGVKIGVLSNGVNSLAALQASGDLPPVTVLPGQAGSGDEGTAMLEIVHDLAPNAQLFFATGSGGPAAMAQNVRDLRAAGCDIIIDDNFYVVESPFQKGQSASVVSTTNGGVIQEAINAISASGALFFTSAGNGGNLNDGTSGTWEGDFVDGGAATVETGRLHDFGGGTNHDTVTAVGSAAALFWSDPLGASSNDYDLYVLNASGTAVVAASNNVQTGTQDPYEQVPAPAVNSRLVIVRHSGVGRFLHLSTYRGHLAIATAGETHGHSAPAAANALRRRRDARRAGIPVSILLGVDTSRPSAPTALAAFFFQADGSAITPGNLSATGGQLVQKPDIAAADGVSCAAPGFATFFGTSAAAPHAGAIAALVKSANPALTPAQIRTLLISNAIDVEAAGVDRDSGAGVLDAYASVAATGVAPKAFLVVETPVLAEANGDGNGVVEPGECAELTVPLTNGSGSIAATAISATLTTSTPGVTIAAGTTAYADLAGGATGSGSAPFQFSLSNTVSCPLLIDFTLTVTFTGGASPYATHVLVRAGQPAWTLTTTLDTVAPSAPAGATGSTGLQAGRLFRGGVVSTCLVPKPYPGPSGSASLRYDSYAMSNCSSQTACVTARLTQNSGTGAALFLSAYATAYDPSNVATNYAADAGSSGPLGIPQPLSFNVAGGSTFVIVVNEVNANGGSGAGYTLSVDGVCLPCAAYTGTGNCCDTPPSATITASAGACAGLSGAAASVPDAGAGSTYAWTIGNGTINSGAGTRAISFTPGPSGSVGLAVTVTRGAACASSGTKAVAITATASCEQTPEALAVDPSSAGGANGNGILEPGETVVVSPSWKNIAGSVALTGAATAFGGPGGATYTLADATAAYGTVGAGATSRCLEATGDCFQLGVSSPLSVRRRTGTRPSRRP